MAPSVLTRAKALIEPALRRAVDDLDPALRLPASYHLGWCDERGEPIGNDAGKGMRGALAVLGCEAVGASAAQAIPGAAAVELIHNFSLIHDDIMDGDRLRRHRRTVWDVYGVDDAILVGDAMHTRAFEVMFGAELSPESMRAAQRLAAATSAMIAGQAQDVALDRAETATLDECIAMEANKTGALLAQSVAIGGELGGGSAAQVTALEQYGMALGRSFQAVDDILGIWGDPDVTGKPAGNDLRERKKSVPVVIAMGQGGEVGGRVREIYAEEPSADDIAELRALLDSSGVRAEVQALAVAELERSVTALREPGLSASAVAELTDLAQFVVNRDH